MARVAFPLVLQSPSTGSAIAGATATITQHVVGQSLGSGPAATIYTSETGAGTVTGNQITTDSTGRWTQGPASGFAQYWLAQGTYDIAISGTSLTAYTITRELISAGQADEVALAGEVKLGAWVSLPNGFLWCDGTAYSRTNYSALFNAITIRGAGSPASGSPTVSSVSAAVITALQANFPTSGLAIPISGTGIPGGTVVTGYNAGASTLTLSQNASASGSGVVLVLAPHGVGDGSTTFNVPNISQRVPLVSDHSTYLPGVAAGESVHTLTAAEMPTHTHTDSGHVHGGTTDSGPAAFGAQVPAAATVTDHLITLGTDWHVPTYNGAWGGSTLVHNHTFTTNSGVANLSSVGGGGSHNNMPPYLVLQGIVRHGLQ